MPKYIDDEGNPVEKSRDLRKEMFQTGYKQYLHEQLTKQDHVEGSVEDVVPQEGKQQRHTIEEGPRKKLTGNELEEFERQRRETDHHKRMGEFKRGNKNSFKQ